MRSSDFRYTVLILGAFLLEAAGYIAFPFLSLYLRNHFLLTEATIGTYLLIAVSLRPAWALLGGYLSERLRPILIFGTACLAESVGFLALGIGSSKEVALFAVVIGNLGFSFWTPNLFALVYQWYDGAIATKRISVLNGALFSGATMGCLIGAFLGEKDLRPLFLGAGFLYAAIVPLLGWILPKRIEKKPESASTKLSLRTATGVWLVVIATLGFWASYSQFNSYFSLYANDWLRHQNFTGIAFGVETALVAIFSFLLPYVATKPGRLETLTLVSAVIFCAGWVIKTFSPGLVSAGLFLLTLGYAEACFSIFLVESWSNLMPNRISFMQSLGFAAKNIAMGVGSYAGGALYGSSSLLALKLWGMENVILVVISIAALVVLRLRETK